MSDRQDLVKSQGEGNEKPPAWEWAVAALGAAVLLVFASYLAHDAFFGPRVIATPHAQVLRTQRLHDRHAITASIHNQGSESLAELKVVATLRRQGTVVESADTVLAFLPRHASRTVTFYFDNDPALHDVVVKAESSQKP